MTDRSKTGTGTGTGSDTGSGNSNIGYTSLLDSNSRYHGKADDIVNRSFFALKNMGRLSENQISEVSGMDEEEVRGRLAFYEQNNATEIQSRR